jgi:TP901 family phage tail tape measure protein
MGDDLDYLKRKALEMESELYNAGIKIKESGADILEAYKLVASAKPELLANKEALHEMTKESLILSKASGQDLATSVKNLTQIMNQYNAPVNQAAKYTNALAAGSKFGSGEIPYLANAITRFGVAAKSANVPLEKSVAVVELFAEKGLKAETAGINFKNILIELQKDTRNYTNGQFDFNKALENLIPIQSDVVKLTNQFGKENILAAQILAQNIDRINELTEAVEGTNTAYEQAEINTDTLTASTGNLKTAWENLTTSVNEGNGKVSKSLKKVVYWARMWVEAIRLMNMNRDEKEEYWMQKRVDNAIESMKQQQAFEEDGIEYILFLKQEKAKKEIELQKQIGSKQNEIDTLRNKKLKNENDRLTLQMYKGQLNKLREDLLFAKLYKKELEGIATQLNEVANAENEESLEKKKQADEETLKRRKKELEDWLKSNQEVSEKIDDYYIKLYQSLTEEATKYYTEEEKLKEKHRSDALKTIEEEQEAEKKAWREKEEAQIAFEEKKQQIREQYNLMSQGELMAKELFDLNLQYQKKLISEEDYQKAKKAIEQKYLDESLYQNRQKFEQEMQVAQQALGTLGSMFSTLKDMELAKLQEVNQMKGESDEDYAKRQEALEKKKKEVHKKYADVEFAIQSAQIAASTALAVAQINANPAVNLDVSQTLRTILTALVVANGLAQLAAANQQRSMVKGLYMGGYTGNGDPTQEAGRFPNGQPFHKQEYVIPHFIRDNPVVANMENVIESIRQQKIGGYYSGGETESSVKQQVPSYIPELIFVLNKISQRLENPIPSEIDWTQKDTAEVKSAIHKLNLVEQESKLYERTHYHWASGIQTSSDIPIQ